MRQIIQSGPSEFTLRQQAFKDSLNQMGQGLGGVFEAAGKQQATKRQQALELAQMGASPEDIQAYQDETSGWGGMFGGGGEAQGRITKMLSDRAAAKEKMASDDRASSRQDKELERESKRLQNQKTQAEIDKLKNPTANTADIKQNQWAAGGFAKRARMAVADLDKLPSDVGTGGIIDTIMGSDFFPNAAKPENRKLFDQASKNFISAVLRKESGAAISPQEYQAEAEKYFPQPGDTEVVLAQKARAREQAILNLEAEAGGAINHIASAPREVGNQGAERVANNLSPMLFNGQQPSIPYAPNAQVANQFNPIQNANASQFSNVPTDALAKRREELMRKAGGN